MWRTSSATVVSTGTAGGSGRCAAGSTSSSAGRSSGAAATTTSRSTPDRASFLLGRRRPAVCLQQRQRDVDLVDSGADRRLAEQPACCPLVDLERDDEDPYRDVDPHRLP